MRCQNRITKRLANGNRELIIRCANPQCPRFTQTVDVSVCEACQYQVKVEKTARPCAPKIPSLPRRAATWAQAVVNWKLAGSPKRSDEEVERLFSTYCATTPPCAWYDPEKKLCRGCGCKVSTNSQAVFNKIRMATEHCPRGLW